MLCCILALTFARRSGYTSCRHRVLSLPLFTRAAWSTAAPCASCESVCCCLRPSLLWAQVWNGHLQHSIRDPRPDRRLKSQEVRRKKMKRGDGQPRASTQSGDASNPWSYPLDFIATHCAASEDSCCAAGMLTLHTAGTVHQI